MRFGTRAGVVLLMSVVACSSGGTEGGNNGGGSNPVTAVTPADSATDVATNATLSATFTTPPQSVQFTLVPAASGSVALSATVATFTPAQGLQPGTAYAVLVTADGS